MPCTFPDRARVWPERGGIWMPLARETVKALEGIAYLPW
jgi:hypothetical protein